MTEVDGPASEALAHARLALRKRRFRTVLDGGEVAAERGYLRETGNLVFHASLVVVLLGVALGALFSYRADVLLTQGRSFTNSVVMFDSLDAGALFDESTLEPFVLRLDRFRMDFFPDGPQKGAPRTFAADVTIREAPDAAARRTTIEVNRPLSVDGTLIHALNPGYALQLTVRTPEGEIAFAEAVPFLPQDGSYASTGVLKVPAAGPDLGIEGLFLPTAALDSAGPRSVSPNLGNPALFLTSYTGDLGLDDGVPQSVFRLDTRRMSQERGPSGEPWRAVLDIGATTRLPSGWTVTLDGVQPWVNLQVSRSVGKWWVLAGVTATMIGLVLSMTVPRRRAWMRVTEIDGSRSRLEIAVLDRSPGGDPQREVEVLMAASTPTRADVDREAV